MAKHKVKFVCQLPCSSKVMQMRTYGQQLYVKTEKALYAIDENGELKVLH